MLMLVGLAVLGIASGCRSASETTWPETYPDTSEIDEAETLPEYDHEDASDGLTSCNTAEEESLKECLARACEEAQAQIRAAASEGCLSTSEVVNRDGVPTFSQGMVDSMRITVVESYIIPAESSDSGVTQGYCSVHSEFNCKY